MSLFSSIRMAGNTLRANDIALQVVGQNIANANTPGYLRENIELSPSPTQKLGGVLLGTGVQVVAITQQVDKFLEERLRGSVSDVANYDALKQTYAQLEGILGELKDTDLSSSMTEFFNSISEILNQPESVSARNLTVLQGNTLTYNIRQMTQRIMDLRSDVNDRVQGMAGEMNRVIEGIRNLNVKIAEMEGGNISKSDAVGLRDQRNQDLEALAKMIDIRSIEQPDGTVTVYSGGDYLVFAGISRKVEVVLESDRGLSTASIHLADTDAPINPSSGELRGLLDSRDAVLGALSDKLDSFTQTLLFEFNKVYSSGQGLKGYSSISSTYHVDDPTVPLNKAGLNFAPQNGSFEVMVRNKQTGLTKTSDIVVDLNGLGADMTLNDLSVQLNKIDGIKAEVTVSGGLTIRSLASDQEFSFGNDTSGVLAAMGINTFFTGSSSLDIDVNAVVKKDPATFAASRGGIALDTDNAIEMANFTDRPIVSLQGDTLSVAYDRMIGETTQGSTVASASSESAGVFENTLRGQKLSQSGVNLDEEAVRMISYQRTYQASARYIAVLSELFDTLVKI